MQEGFTWKTWLSKIMVTGGTTPKCLALLMSHVPAPVFKTQLGTHVADQALEAPRSSFSLLGPHVRQVSRYRLGMDTPDIDCSTDGSHFADEVLVHLDSIGQNIPRPFSF